jgi:hypothetical protein
MADVVGERPHQANQQASPPVPPIRGHWALLCSIAYHLSYLPLNTTLSVDDDGDQTTDAHVPDKRILRRACAGVYTSPCSDKSGSAYPPSRCHPDCSTIAVCPAFGCNRVQCVCAKGCPHDRAGPDPNLGLAPSLGNQHERPAR